MSKKETRRISPSTLRDDRAGFAALQVTAGYAPAKADYTLDAVTALRDRMDALRVAETQAYAAAATARDEATEAEWKFHNAMLGVKAQVTAQYGPDSNEVQSLGLKKKSEYKSPTRRKPGGTSTT